MQVRHRRLLIKLKELFRGLVPPDYLFIAAGAVAVFVGLPLVMLMWLTFDSKAISENERYGDKYEVSFGHFNGSTSWRQPETLRVRRVVETTFGTCDLHTVRLPDGSIVNDWLWWSEFDQVNVIARKQADNKFLFFRQRKYGIEGETIAPVGGLMDKEGESAEMAAARELAEETGYESKKWIKLGKFRISCNRGGGFLHSFLALDATPLDEKFSSTGDLEKQRFLHLSIDEARQALLQGEIKEAKWSLSLSMALIWLDSERGIK